MNKTEKPKQCLRKNFKTEAYDKAKCQQQRTQSSNTLEKYSLLVQATQQQQLQALVTKLIGFGYMNSPLSILYRKQQTYHKQ